MILEQILAFILICVSVHFKGIQTNEVQGIPGVDYPNYSYIPRTSFRCSNQLYNPGFYADLETKCQVFHYCYMHRQESFLCATGTTFNQAILSCDYWYSSDCSQAPSLYSNNGLEERVDDNVDYLDSSEKLTSSNNLFEKMASLYEDKVEPPPCDFEEPQNLEINPPEKIGEGDIEFHSRFDNTERFGYESDYANNMNPDSTEEKVSKHSQATKYLQNDRQSDAFAKISLDDYGYRKDDNHFYYDKPLDPLNDKIPLTHPFNYYENDFVEAGQAKQFYHSNSESSAATDDITMVEEILKSNDLSKRISEENENVPKRRMRPKPVYAIAQPELEIVTLPPIKPKRNRASLRESYLDAAISGPVVSGQSSDIKKPISMIKILDQSANSGIVKNSFDENENLVIDYQEGNPITDYQEGNPVNYEEGYPDFGYEGYPDFEYEEGNPELGYEEGHPAFGNQKGHPAFGNQEGHPAFGNQEGHPAFGNQEGHPAFGNQEKEINEDVVDVRFTEDYSFASGDADFFYTEENNKFNVFSNSQQDIIKAYPTNVNQERTIEGDKSLKEQQHSYIVGKTGTKSQTTDSTETELTHGKKNFPQMIDSHLKVDDTFQTDEKQAFLPENLENGDSYSSILNMPLIHFDNSETEKDFRDIIPEFNAEHSFDKNSATNGILLDSYEIDYNYGQTESDFDDGDVIPVLPFRDTDFYDFPDTLIETKKFPKVERNAERITRLEQISDSSNWEKYQNSAFGEKNYFQKDQQEISEKILEVGDSFIGDPEVPSRVRFITMHEKDNTGVLNESALNSTLHKSQKTNEYSRKLRESGVKFDNEDDNASNFSNVSMLDTDSDQSVRGNKTFSAAQDIEEIANDSLSLQGNLGNSTKSDNVFIESENELEEHSTITPAIGDFESETLHDLTTTDGLYTLDSTLQTILYATHLDDFYKFGTTSQTPHTRKTVSSNFNSNKETTAFQGQSSFFEAVNFEEQENTDEKMNWETDQQPKLESVVHPTADIGSSFVTILTDIPKMSTWVASQTTKVYTEDNLDAVKKPILDDAKTRQLQNTEGDRFSEFTKGNEESDQTEVSSFSSVLNDEQNIRTSPMYQDFEQSAKNDSLRVSGTPRNASDSDQSVSFDDETFDDAKSASVIEESEQNASDENLSGTGFVKFEASQKSQASTSFLNEEKESIGESEQINLEKSSVEDSDGVRNVNEHKNGKPMLSNRDSTSDGTTQTSLGLEELVTKERVLQLFPRSICSTCTSSSNTEFQYFPLKSDGFEKSEFTQRTGRLIENSKFSDLIAFTKKLMVAKKAKLNILKRLFYMPIFDKELN